MKYIFNGIMAILEKCLYILAKIQQKWKKMPIYSYFEESENTSSKNVSKYWVGNPQPKCCQHSIKKKGHFQFFLFLN